MHSYRLTHLKELESESMHILREVASQFDNPTLLFSGGKDSILCFHLARKAFFPAKVPFPLLHVDTGHNFSETIEFRDRLGCVVATAGLFGRIGQLQFPLKQCLDCGTGRFGHCTRLRLRVFGRQKAGLYRSLAQQFGTGALAHFLGGQGLLRHRQRDTIDPGRRN